MLASMVERSIRSTSPGPMPTKSMITSRLAPGLRVGDVVVVEDVVAAAAGEPVQPVAAGERVVVEPAVERVVAGAAAEFVCAGLAIHRVGAGLAAHLVVAGAAVHLVVAVVAKDPVGAVVAVERVVAVPGIGIAACAVDQVVAGAAPDGVRVGLRIPGSVTAGDLTIEGVVSGAATDRVFPAEAAIDDVVSAHAVERVIRIGPVLLSPDEIGQLVTGAVLAAGIIPAGHLQVLDVGGQRVAHVVGKDGVGPLAGQLDDRVLCFDDRILVVAGAAVEIVVIVAPRDAAVRVVLLGGREQLVVSGSAVLVDGHARRAADVVAADGNRVVAGPTVERDGSAWRRTLPRAVRIVAGAE